MSSSLSENLAAQTVARNANSAKRKKVMDAVLALAAEHPLPDSPTATLLPSSASTAPVPGMPVGPVPLGSSGNAAVKLAEGAIGTPYVWGGNDLKAGVDCSGLVQQVYGRLGIKLPRTAAEQARAGLLVPAHQAQPGDLVSFDEGPRVNGADHIGIYAGNGKMIVAPHTGDHVRVQDISAIGVTPVFTRVPGHPAPVPKLKK